MLAYPLEEKRLNKWPLPCICQPKFDGIRCRAVPTPGGYLLLSSEENPIFSVPHIRASINENFDSALPGAPELDGELYGHHLEFEDIQSLVLRDSVHPRHEEIKYHVFDFAAPLPQIKRTRVLADQPPMNWIEWVDFELAYSLEDVMKYYAQFISDGYEGIIVRNIRMEYIRRRSVGMMKFKPRKKDCYRIIGYEEEVSKSGVPKGTLGALVLTDNEGNVFNVGTGFDKPQRQDLWNERGRLISKWCIYSYQHTYKSGKPKFTSFVQISDEEVKFD